MPFPRGLTGTCGSACVRNGPLSATPIIIRPIGESAWSMLIDAFYTKVRGLLGQYRGREISTAGDGLLATFDGPARAVRCASAIGDALRPLDLKVRCGLHTGECEFLAHDVVGIAVHIGARVAALDTCTG